MMAASAPLPRSVGSSLLPSEPWLPIAGSIEAPQLPLAPLQQHLNAPMPKEALKRIKGFPLLTKDSPVVAIKGSTNLQKMRHNVCSL